MRSSLIVRAHFGLRGESPSFSLAGGERSLKEEGRNGFRSSFLLNSSKIFPPPASERKVGRGKSEFSGPTGLSLPTAGNMEYLVTKIISFRSKFRGAYVQHRAIR